MYSANIQKFKIEKLILTSITKLKNDTSLSYQNFKVAEFSDYFCR